MKYCSESSSGIDAAAGKCRIANHLAHSSQFYKAGARLVGVFRRLSTILLASCSMITVASAQTSTFSSEPQSEGLRPDGDPVAIVEGLNIPWSVTFVGDEALVSERNTGEIKAFRPNEPARSVGIVPGMVQRADGGLLGIAALELNNVTWVYAFHCGDRTNRIVRMPYTNGTLGEVEVVIDGLPGGRGHNGGRIAFGPDGMLYATTGETQEPELSQDPESLAGKILRMTPDGEIPEDNPFPGSLVYSMGHRHPQGLAWDEYGQLWATEFGDDAWDELNRIEPGGNYGWPIVEGIGDNPDFVNPVLQLGPKQWGPSGLAYIEGTFFVAGLTGQKVVAITVNNEGVAVANDYYVGELGRLRHVLEGPDGKLWIVANKTDGRGGATPTAEDDRIYTVPLASAKAP